MLSNRTKPAKVASPGIQSSTWEAEGWRAEFKASLCYKRAPLSQNTKVINYHRSILIKHLDQSKAIIYLQIQSNLDLHLLEGKGSFLVYKR